MAEKLTEIELFYQAIEAGDIKSILSTIDKVSTVELNSTMPSGKTPLTCSCFWDDKEIVKLLIQKGADINKKDEFGNTALIEASYWNSDKVVRYLMGRKTVDFSVVGCCGMAAVQLCRESSTMGLLAMKTKERLKV